MWKVVLLVCFACSLFSEEVSAQGGAESIPFHGFIPIENVRARKPVGDNGPNDVYGHLPVRTPKLLENEIALYPHHFGFEFGQDPESKAYVIQDVNEFVAPQGKKISNNKEKLPQIGKHTKPNSLLKSGPIMEPLKHDRPPPPLHQGSLPPLFHPTFPSSKQQKQTQGSRVHPHFG